LTEPLVRLTGVTKRFGPETAAHPLNLSIAAGDFLAILGPSGCGKTTLLRMLGGLEAPSEGTIEIAGANVTALGPEKRPTNMVFQGYGLFPHMNVRQNVGYGLRLRRLASSQIERRVGEILSLVRLDDFADRPVQKLSGGQQQRVALARALVMRPAVLLLDEPLAALDLKLRQAMQAELRRIHRSLGGTFVFVTHDQEEALGLASRIVVMEAGRVVQEGGAEAIYHHPASRFVSTFIGEANLVEGTRSKGVIRLACGGSFPSDGRDGSVSVMVRPEAVRFDVEPIMTGTVFDRVFLGPFTKVLVRLADGTEITSHLRETSTDSIPPIDAEVRIGWRLEEARCLDAS
jgi:ABC-type Fe3+/spermidine/putrescine transport system ATPase subunit